jgi:hypothetical protein
MEYLDPSNHQPLHQDAHTRKLLVTIKSNVHKHPQQPIGITVH